MKNMKQKLQYGFAVAVTAALPAIASANDLIDAAKTEIGGLKAGVTEIGLACLSVTLVIVAYNYIKRAAK